MTARPIGYRLQIHPGEDLTLETEAERLRIEQAWAKFGTENWDGQPIRRPGTRVPFPTTKPASTWVHKCGGQFTSGHVACPGCKTELFPMFRLDMSDAQVAEIVAWPLPTLELPVCPGCILFHCDYSVDFSQTPFTILSDQLPANEEAILEIVTPYESRDVTLRPLELNEYPDSEELVEYEGHQIGGVPPRWYSQYEHNTCPKCKSMMQYVAVIHYDSENVPLFERCTRKLHRSRSQIIESPVAFCLGDCKSYYVFTCPDCLVLTYRYAM